MKLKGIVTVQDIKPQTIDRNCEAGMNLTLNDFRSVLGVKNDGDDVMTLDKKGMEKAN